MTQDALLRQVGRQVELLTQRRKNPVVVFDLDGTLFDNGPRSLQILRDFALSHHDLFLLSALKKLEQTPLPYLVSDMLKIAGVDDDNLINSAVAYWSKCFFTDRYQRYDVPVVGAVRYVQGLFATGATIVYLSGRDAPGMLLGCSESLRRFGFPVGKLRSVLLLKPDFHMADSLFKEDAAEFIAGLGDTVAAFDNEPYNCNLFRRVWPCAKSVLIDTQCAPGAPVLDRDCHVIRNFLM